MREVVAISIAGALLVGCAPYSARGPVDIRTDDVRHVRLLDLPTAAPQGRDGWYGETGSKGVDWADSDEHVAGAGAPGESGESGEDGHDGEAGPVLTAFVTRASTPSAPDVVAVRIHGSRDDLLLFPRDRPIVIVAAGQDGGGGGHGGDGGWGGQGGFGRRRRSAGAAGPGGNGGDGGNGGHGGDGGQVSVVIDARFPELAAVLKVDVHGGHGGYGGGGGVGGRMPRNPGWQSNLIGNEWPGVGSHGRNGARGADGDAGTVSIALSDDVRSAFADVADKGVRVE